MLGRRVDVGLQLVRAAVPPRRARPLLPEAVPGHIHPSLPPHSVVPGFPALTEMLRFASSGRRAKNSVALFSMTCLATGAARKAQQGETHNVGPGAAAFAEMLRYSSTGSSTRSWVPRFCIACAQARRNELVLATLQGPESTEQLLLLMVAMCG